MAYMIPMTKADHELAIFRPGTTIETRKGLPVHIAWTQEGYQGFVVFDKRKMFLTWNKLGQCDAFKDRLLNKNYDLFYRVREDEPNPSYQLAFNELICSKVPLKFVCQADALFSFNLHKYVSGGYELETRNGFKIPALEFTGDEKKVFRGADNMRHLRWTRTGKINANGVEHELDLMMRKVKVK